MRHAEPREDRLGIGEGPLQFGVALLRPAERVHLDGREGAEAQQSPSGDPAAVRRAAQRRRRRDETHRQTAGVQDGVGVEGGQVRLGPRGEEEVGLARPCRSSRPVGCSSRAVCRSSRPRERPVIFIRRGSVPCRSLLTRCFRSGLERRCVARRTGGRAAGGTRCIRLEDLVHLLFERRQVGRGGQGLAGSQGRGEDLLPASLARVHVQHQPHEAAHEACPRAPPQEKPAARPSRRLHEAQHRHQVPVGERGKRMRPGGTGRVQGRRGVRHVGAGQVRQGQQRRLTPGRQVAHGAPDGLQVACGAAAGADQVRRLGLGVRAAVGRAPGDLVADLPPAGPQRLPHLPARTPSAVEVEGGVDRLGPRAATGERRLCAPRLGPQQGQIEHGKTPGCAVASPTDGTGLSP